VRNFNGPQPSRAKNTGTASGKTATEPRWARPRRETAIKDGTPAGFYEVVGSTPFANDYQFEFAKELVLYEKLGAGPATDLLVISLSANDILGHQVGPDSPQMHSMALELDRQLAEFFDFLGPSDRHGQRLDGAFRRSRHCASCLISQKTLRLPAANLDTKALREQINSLLSKNTKKADYVSISITR
jgi:hypothetical protein